MFLLFSVLSFNLKRTRQISDIVINRFEQGNLDLLKQFSDKRIEAQGNDSQKFLYKRLSLSLSHNGVKLALCHKRQGSVTDEESQLNDCLTSLSPLSLLFHHKQALLLDLCLVNNLSSVEVRNTSFPLTAREFTLSIRYTQQAIRKLLSVFVPTRR